jgi:inner membrane protein
MKITKPSASTKAGVLAAIAVILLIPLLLLGGLVADRARERDTAAQSVARGWGDRQWVGGPILAIPVTSDSDASHTRDWYVLPKQLNIVTQLQVQETRRRLGLYDVPVYIAQVHVSGEFDLSAELARLARGGDSLRFHLDQARLLLPIKDPRGLRDLSTKTPGFQELEPSSGFLIPVLAAPLTNAADWSLGPHSFDLSFSLAGTQALEFLPLAHAVKVEMQGNWPDPGFTDGFLPIERTVGARGFSAQWQVLNLNRTYGDRWFEGSTTMDTLLASGFGVELVQPVDIYQRCTRAVKYGGLFIALSFLTLFLVESLRRRPLHPIQYGLMGLALCIFYLLLLALAEHIGFLPAYLVATAALCALMSAYLAGALQSAAGGGVSGGALAATYALLYLLITSEDYALLAGAIALFALLAVTMLLTRRMDWYAQVT